MKKIFNKFICLFRGHKWTSAAMQGKKPTDEQLKYGGFLGFKDYAKMYCERCGHVSKLNNLL